MTAGPVSLPVLGAATLISSPALYDALVTGSLPLGTALVRFLVAAAVVWVGLSLVGGLVSATSPTPAASEPLRALPAGDRSPADGPATADFPAADV